MKRIIIAMVALLASVALSAQGYDFCKTTWPYLYESFTDGTIYMVGGTKLIQKVNVCVVGNKLHFIDKEIVKEANMGDVLVVEIGGDSYMLVGGMLLFVEAKAEDGVVASLIEADLAQLNETGGAYGASGVTMATQKMSSIASNDVVNQNHMLILQEKNRGQKLTLKKTYYVVCNGEAHKAVKSTIERSLDKDQKEAFKAFLKTNKIKWADPNSMLSLIDFYKQIADRK